jgi:hypothetical protein
MITGRCRWGGRRWRSPGPGRYGCSSSRCWGIICRVISYAIITAVLAGLFAGLVLLATQVLPFKGPAAVAAATLAVAALFNPLRRRVQRAVDRRFNRARYDAEIVIAAFTARLRQTVDLDAIQGDLVDAVDAAFQPAHVSVWLPPRT